MDPTARNDRRRVIQGARRLVEPKFATPLEGNSDILPDGRILSEPAAHLDGRRRIARREIAAAIGPMRVKDGNKTTARVVDDNRREAAFTFLNCLAALDRRGDQRLPTAGAEGMGSLPADRAGDRGRAGGRCRDGRSQAGINPRGRGRSPLLVPESFHPFWPRRWTKSVQKTFHPSRRGRLRVGRLRVASSSSGSGTGSLGCGSRPFCLRISMYPSRSMVQSASLLH
jgi:hypothetical protein